MAWLGYHRKVTWELESNIPVKLIEEFESGVRPEVVTSSEEKYGVIAHTLITSTNTATDEPNPKRMKTVSTEQG